MPRNASNQYNLPPGVLAQPNTTVRSAPYNEAMLDIAEDLNRPRPPTAGGTGATSAAAARSVLGAISFADVANMLRGMVVPFPMTTPPEGWLVCDGRAVSRTTYAALFALVGTSYGSGNGSTTFNLPDLRGEFIRGVDQERGIDPDRALGSGQADAVKAHTHTGTTSSAGAHSHTYNYLAVSSGSVFQAGSNWGTVSTGDSTSSAGAHVHNVSVDSSGGAESRPRNIAMVFYIKF